MDFYKYLQTTHFERLYAEQGEYTTLSLKTVLGKLPQLLASCLNWTKYFERKARPIANMKKEAQRKLVLTKEEIFRIQNGTLAQQALEIKEKMLGDGTVEDINSANKIMQIHIILSLLSRVGQRSGVFCHIKVDAVEDALIPKSNRHLVKVFDYKTDCRDDFGVVNVVLTPGLYCALRFYKDLIRPKIMENGKVVKPHDLLFVTSTGNPLLTTSVSTQVQQEAAKLNINPAKLVPSMMRKSCTTRALRTARGQFKEVTSSMKHTEKTGLKDYDLEMHEEECLIAERALNPESSEGEGLAGVADFGPHEEFLYEVEAEDFPDELQEDEHLSQPQEFGNTEFIDGEIQLPNAPSPHPNESSTSEYEVYTSQKTPVKPKRSSVITPVKIYRAELQSKGFFKGRGKPDQFSPDENERLMTHFDCCTRGTEKICLKYVKDVLTENAPDILQTHSITNVMRKLRYFKLKYKKKIINLAGGS